LQHLTGVRNRHLATIARRHRNARAVVRPEGRGHAEVGPSGCTGTLKVIKD
jgi:hypothetical protein